MESHSASVYFCTSFPAGPFVPSLPLNISLIYDQEAASKQHYFLTAPLFIIIQFYKF